MEKHLTTDVFTPTTPAKLTYVDRIKNELNDDLVDALKTPGKQIVIYGHSGTGKSTLLINVLNRLYGDYIITRCTSEMSFDQLMLNAFDQLNIYYDSSSSHKKTTTKATALSLDYIALKGNIGIQKAEENTTTSQRIIPPQLTAQRLAEFMGAAECCWVIEDFHKIKNPEKKKLSQQLKVFVDTSEKFKDVKAILIGAVGTAREVIEYDSEMNHRISELYVPLLEDTELHAILNKGERLLNIKLSDKQKDQIVKFSSGLASITHQIALNMCMLNNITETQENKFSFTDEHFKKAIKKYINSKSDTYKKRYDRATKVGRSRKFNNGLLIIEALAEFAGEEAQKSEILAIIKKRKKAYPASNLSTYLQKLQTEEKGAIIAMNLENGKYSFSDPFIASYIKCIKEINSKKIKDPKQRKDIVQLAIEMFTSDFFDKIFK